MSTPRLGALALIETVLDEGSYVSWDTPITPAPDLEPGYLAELAAAQQKSGSDESILTGRGTIRGRAVAVVSNEFRFLGGSI